MSPVKKLLDLLAEFPPEEYFCVSTDKAANPVYIMGASKRIMEDAIFSYSDKFPVKTVRFATVAFPNGSLSAGFIDRISKLQSISAPSDVRRYLVSSQERGQICMLVCMLGKNREIYFPKLEDRFRVHIFSDTYNILYALALCLAAFVFIAIHSKTILRYGIYSIWMLLLAAYCLVKRHELIGLLKRK